MGAVRNWRASRACSRWRMLKPWPVDGLRMGSDTIVTKVTFMAKRQSTVVSMRLPAASGVRLQRLARRHGWSASEASARLVEEGLRRSEFAFVDFRDSAVGRQAYVQGSRLAIWQVIGLLRSGGENLDAVARQLEWPRARVQAAVNYAQAFPEEIQEALADNEALGFAVLQRMLPQAREFRAGARRKR